MNTRNLGAGLVALLLVASSPCVAFAADAVPPTLTYSGYITDAQQAPLDGTTIDATFTLYDAATGGTAVWAESFTGVPVTRGHFTVLLGSSDGTNPTGSRRSPMS